MSACRFPLQDLTRLSAMTPPGPKSVLQHYLQTGREALPWKLEGLSPYDVRRPR